MRRFVWLAILAGPAVAAGCSPQLRPEDSALRSLAPRGSYEKLAPETRGWSGAAKPIPSGE